MSDAAKLNVLFVCLGNICRSPTAEGVFRGALKKAGLADVVGVDSAGTADYHTGNPPDPRAIAAAAERGVDLSKLAARQAVRADFDRFDYVIGMDNSNYSNLARLSGEASPANLHLLLEFADAFDDTEVPDPYYGGDAGFALVLKMIDDACVGLIRDIRQRLGEQA